MFSAGTGQPASSSCAPTIVCSPGYTLCANGVCQPSNSGQCPPAVPCPTGQVTCPSGQCAASVAGCASLGCPIQVVNLLQLYGILLVSNSNRFIGSSSVRKRPVCLGHYAMWSYDCAQWQQRGPYARMSRKQTISLQCSLIFCSTNFFMYITLA